MRVYSHEVPTRPLSIHVSQSSLRRLQRAHSSSPTLTSGEPSRGQTSPRHSASLTSSTSLLTSSLAKSRLPAPRVPQEILARRRVVYRRRLKYVLSTCLGDIHELRPIVFSHPSAQSLAHSSPQSGSASQAGNGEGTSTTDAVTTAVDLEQVSSISPPSWVCSHHDHSAPIPA